MKLFKICIRYVNELFHGLNGYLHFTMNRKKNHRRSQMMQRDKRTTAPDNANKTVIRMRALTWCILVIEALNERQHRRHSIISLLDSDANPVLLQAEMARLDGLQLATNVSIEWMEQRKSAQFTLFSMWENFEYVCRSWCWWLPCGNVKSSFSSQISDIFANMHPELTARITENWCNRMFLQILYKIW